MLANIDPRFGDQRGGLMALVEARVVVVVIAYLAARVVVTPGDGVIRGLRSIRLASKATFIHPS